MPPRVGVEGRDAHQPVHARFGLEPAVGVVALDQERRRLDAGLLAVLLVDELDLVAARLRPSACTCASASAPSPGSRCRPRRHGPRGRCRCRRPRRRAAPRPPARWASSPQLARAPPRLPRRRPRRPRPRRARSASTPSSSSRSSGRTLRAHPRAAGAGASPSARGCGSLQRFGSSASRSARQGAARPCPSQRCLRSRASDCWMASTSVSVSARIASSGT